MPRFFAFLRAVNAGRRSIRLEPMRALLGLLAVTGLTASFAWRDGQVPAGAAATPSSTGGPMTYGYEVVRAYPHDREAFTQGLIYKDGFLFESTGLHGRSSLRKVRLETGEVVQRVAVPAQHFAEGLADWGRSLVQLTWQSQVGFVYDTATFKRIATFTFNGEGWGLARDAQRLVMSDGTATLRWLDPTTFKETARLTVTDRGAPVTNLNELEVIKGEIYANVWGTDRIAIIDPGAGRVAGWIDMSGLLTPAERASVDVLNGIAYDASRDRMFVTGKLYPKLFEIRLKPRR
jgi:glutamine cyclotransferase